MPKPANTSTRKRDGTTFSSTWASAARATADRRRWSGRLAAAIVEHHRPAERTRHDDGRKRGEEKREVRGRKHVDRDRRAPARGRACGPYVSSVTTVRSVLDSSCPSQRRRWLGVDRHQPGFDIGIALPGTNQPVCLDGLAAEDPQRRSDDRNAKSSHADESRTGARAEPQRSSLPCKPRARSGRGGRVCRLPDGPHLEFRLVAMPFPFDQRTVITHPPPGRSLDAAPAQRPRLVGFL